MIKIQIKNNILAVCLVYMCALNVMVYVNNGIYKMIVLVIASLSLINALRNNHVLQLNGILIWWLLFTLWGIMSFLWSYHVDKDTAIVLCFIAFNLLFLVNYITSEIRYIHILKAYMFSGVLLGLYLIVHYGIGGIIAHGRIPSDIINSNGAGIIFAFSMIISMYFLLKENNKLYFFLIVGLGIMVLLSGSRSAFLNVALAMSVFVIVYNKNKIKLQYILVIAVIVIIAGYLVLETEVFYNIIGRRMERLWEIVIGKRSLTAGGSGDSTYRRAYLYLLSWKTFLENPLKGVGLNNFRYTNSLNAYAHSNILELLASVGIVGTMLFYGIYIHFIFIFHKYKKYMDQKDRAMIWAFLTEILIISSFNVYYAMLHINAITMILFMGMKVQYNND